jgi:hypothetical protein
MKRTRTPERSFGLSVGPILLLICAYAAWDGHARLAVVSGGSGFGLVALGLLRPSLLKYPSALWWRFALTLGYINTRIILTLAFILVLVPFGLAWRLVGHDPLGWRRGASPGWTPAPTRYRDQLHYLRMY